MDSTLSTGNKHRRSGRGVAGTLAGILIAVPLLLVGGAPPALAASGVGCTPAFTARQAKYNVLGYLFGDGHWASGGGGYNFRSGTKCKTARMKNDLKILGFRYTESGGHFHLANAAPFNYSQEFGAAPDLAPGVATSNDIGLFLSGVLEGEGSGAGKVVDDPYWGHVSAIIDLYKRVGIVVKPDHPAPKCGCATASGFWNVSVDPTASRSTYNGYIAIIRSWPFADWGRVPNTR